MIMIDLMSVLFGMAAAPCMYGFFAVSPKGSKLSWVIGMGPAGARVDARLISQTGLFLLALNIQEREGEPRA